MLDVSDEAKLSNGDTKALRSGLRASGRPASRGMFSSCVAKIVSFHARRNEARMSKNAFLVESSLLLRC